MYPKEIVGCDVPVETRDIQVVDYNGVQYVVLLRTGGLQPLIEAVSYNRHDDGHTYTVEELGKLRGHWLAIGKAPVW